MVADWILTGSCFLDGQLSFATLDYAGKEEAHSATRF